MLNAQSSKHNVPQVIQTLKQSQHASKPKIGLCHLGLGQTYHWHLMLRLASRTVNGQIPGANQDIERQEVALQKQMHMSVAM